MTDKVRIGVIGLGIMGEQYVRIYNAHPLSYSHRHLYSREGTAQ